MKERYETCTGFTPPNKTDVTWSFMEGHFGKIRPQDELLACRFSISYVIYCDHFDLNSILSSENAPPFAAAGEIFGRYTPIEQKRENTVWNRT